MQDYRTVEDSLSKVYGVVPVIVEDYNVAVSSGLVYRTEPASGSTVKMGDTVTLYVSRGTEIETKMVPDFYGLSELDARIQIEKNNLTVGSVSYEYSNERAGTVIRQSRRAFDSVPEGTAIDFVVSLGPETAPENTPQP